MYITHTLGNCTPLRSKEKFLKSTSGLLVQNKSRDKSMKREQALEKTQNNRALYFALHTFYLPTILSGSIFVCRFHLVHVKREH